MIAVEIRVKQCKSAFSPSRLPGLDWAVNPYRGCSHACAYCYAQDVTRFEMSKPWGSVIEVKAGIVQCLKNELGKRPKQGTFGIGTVTDPYQPLEREYELTKGCLAILKRYGMSASVLTKSDLVLRDLDILKSWNGVEVGMSIGCADDEIARLIEPGAAVPTRRFGALRRLADEGVSIYLMAAPIIPGVSDSKESVEHLLDCAQESGVRSVIWDKYNPKPIAGKRIREALAAAGMKTATPHDDQSESHLSRLFSQGCAARGMTVTKAF